VGRIEYPTSCWEAIVVDDGSSAATITAVEEWIASSGVPVRLLRQDHHGPAAARNIGARVTSAGILIFIDNDIIVRPDFITRHLRTLRNHPGCWVIGRIVNPSQLRQTAFGRYRDDRWEAFQLSNAASGVSETSGMTAANLSLPAKDFEYLGGFDEEFAIASCEDWELGLRARAAGIRIIYDPAIVVVHNDWAVSLARFCERQKLYSISDVLLWKKYGEQSPRARLVFENGPIRWDGDAIGLILKKILKRLMVTDVGWKAVRFACGLAERLVPDSGCSRYAYDVAVSLAIFEGVTEGLKRYRGDASPS
jgi:GT2 family glycosyltransferase